MGKVKRFCLQPIKCKIKLYRRMECTIFGVILVYLIVFLRLVIKPMTQWWELWMGGVRSGLGMSKVSWDCFFDSWAGENMMTSDIENRYLNEMTRFAAITKAIQEMGEADQQISKEGWSTSDSSDLYAWSKPGSCFHQLWKEERSVYSLLLSTWSRRSQEIKLELHFSYIFI